MVSLVLRRFPVRQDTIARHGRGIVQGVISGMAAWRALRRYREIVCIFDKFFSIQYNNLFKIDHCFINIQYFDHCCFTFLAYISSCRKREQNDLRNGRGVVMVQFSVMTGGSLPVLESAMAGAARFAEAVRSAPNARAVSAHAGSVSVANDRQHVAASGRLAAEANARSAGARNAAAAVSLLQTADDALAEIGGRLDRLEGLAESARSGERSDLERAQLDTEFQSIKAEIDTIVEQTTFNGAALLQGGDGPGGALEISFRVGSGGDAADTITVTIAPASVADLSGGLDGGDIQSRAGAEAAVDDVATAQEAVGAIRAGIAGDIQRFFSAARHNRAIEASLEEAQSALSSPTVSVDMAQLLATRIAEDGGIRFTDRAIERIQQLLIGLDLPATQAEEKDGGAAREGDTTAAPSVSAGYEEAFDNA
jgi:flagellin